MSHDIVLRLKGSRVLGHMQPHEDGTLDLWITNEKGVTSLGKTLPAAVARKFMSELNPKRPDSIFWAYLGKSRLPDWKAQGRRINPEQAYIQPAWAFNTRTDRACRRS